MNDEMKGKVFLVTGGSTGIGKAAALAFARNGADVVVADVQEKKGLYTVEEIQDMDRRAIYVQTDVSQVEQVENMITKTLDEFGRLDYAFNNAGIEGEQAPTAECTEGNWDRVININLKGVWLCMKYEIPEIVKQGGAIVNNSSVAGKVGFINIPAYTASKHGVLGLTKAAALEYANRGIRINAVCPGIIATEMIERFTQNNEEVRKELLATEPIGRMGKPEEVADVVLCLCSERASYITGHALNVDGGYVSR